MTTALLFGCSQGVLKVNSYILNLCILFVAILFNKQHRDYDLLSNENKKSGEIIEYFNYSPIRNIYIIAC